MTSTTKADLSLVFITLLWGSSFVVIKDVLDSVGPFWLLVSRFLVATVALLLVFPRVLRSRDKGVWRCSLIVGAVLYAGFALQTLGLSLTTPAKSAFITGTSVLLVPTLNLVIFGVSLGRRVGAGILLALAGLFLLTRPDELTSLNAGDLLTLGCAFAFALHIIFVSRFARLVPFQQLAVLQIVFAFLFSLPAGLLLDRPGLPEEASIWIAVLYLGLFCSALAFLIQTRAQQHTPASRTALIFALEPVFAALFSVVFYGENLLWSEWLGGFLVVSGVIIGEMRVLKS